jgi:hypothetical protein
MADSADAGIEHKKVGAWRDAPTEKLSCEYFDDDREGNDRWGTPYKSKMGCGPSLDEACPAYLEESCPGCKNPGNRIRPCQRQTCGGVCGVCGGGGRSKTIAYCGQRKSLFRDSAFMEFNESLRLERHEVDQSHEPVLDFPVRWFPVVEQNRADSGKSGVKDTSWMEQLGGWPVVGTTLKTPFEGIYVKNRTPLRDKLGIDADTTLMVNGLVLDDMLDDIWDDRHFVMETLLNDGVDVFIPPQFSAYPDLQNFMALYNANRVMKMHMEAVEMGFKHVALQHPGGQARWLLDEYFAFAHRCKTKLIALSFQTAHHSMGGYQSDDILDAKLCNEHYPKDAAFIVFGPSSHRLVAQMASVLRGRRLIFANVDAYARSVFFHLYPTMRKAPAGWSKGQVFAHNCKTFAELTDKVLAAAKKR